MQETFAFNRDGQAAKFKGYYICIIFLSMLHFISSFVGLLITCNMLWENNVQWIKAESNCAFISLRVEVNGIIQIKHLDLF